MEDSRNKGELTQRHIRLHRLPQLTGHAAYPRRLGRNNNCRPDARGQDDERAEYRRGLLDHCPERRLARVGPEEEEEEERAVDDCSPDASEDRERSGADDVIVVHVRARVCALQRFLHVQVSSRAQLRQDIVFEISLTDSTYLDIAYVAVDSAHTTMIIASWYAINRSLRR